MLRKILSRHARRLNGIVAMTATMILGAFAHAGSIVQINSANAQGVGSFAGSISYSAASPFSTTGTLVITLANTSSSAGGHITGVLFNIGSGSAQASGSLTGGTHAFTNCTGNGLSGGTSGYSVGAAVGGSFLGGGGEGHRRAGIGVGQTGVFTFAINAQDAGSLTAMDFLSGGGHEFNFLVRFRDARQGSASGFTLAATVVPLPPPIAMGLIGLIGAGFAARRMNRRRPPPAG